MALTVFDHYSNQEKPSVEKFLAAWGKKPFDDMNIPVGLSIAATDNDSKEAVADILVFHPRKEHVKHVYVTIRSEADLKQLQATFRGISELFTFAGSRLEAFAHGWNGRASDDEDSSFTNDLEGTPLYYWSGELPKLPKNS